MVRKGLFKTLAIEINNKREVIGLNSKHGKDSWGLSPKNTVRGVSEWKMTR